MGASVAELIDQLSSSGFNERALALAALVQQGRSATPALTRALEGPNHHLRAQAAQALGEIADPRSADALANALVDSNPDVRAHAAMGLARIADPRAIDALVRTIDDLPDETHYPYTLSVYGLIEMGRRSLPTVVPLLRAADPNTRRRAFLVIRSVLEQLPEGKDWNQRWRSLGRYDPDGDQAERDDAADRWRDWISEHG